MGLSFARNCQCAAVAEAPAPNPSPSRWTLLAVYSYSHAHVLVVRYHDATNFEGVKVMVYRGAFIGRLNLECGLLDPHFSEEDESPIARFRPTEEGIALARELADKLSIAARQAAVEVLVVADVAK